MKSIGIITIHKPQNNYGGALQCFALYEYLRTKGYDVEVIDLLRPNHVDYIKSVRFQPMRKPLSKADYIKGWLLERLGRRISFHWDNTIGLNAEAIQRFTAFNSQVKTSDTYRYIPDLYRNPPIYDIYMAGSDQLWNPTQFYSLKPYFLTFVKNKKALKVSYGTSIGITDLTDKEKKKFGKWLSTFDAISVREMQAKALLETITDQHIERVPDPTFLLEPEVWESLAVSSTKEEPYILVFTLGKRKELLDRSVAIASYHNCRVKVIDQQFKSEITSNRIDVIPDAGPREFIGFIKNAGLVLTDSFHCTVFSLIMGARSFYTYLHPSDTRGSRVQDLLKIFDLEERIVNHTEDIPYDDRPIEPVQIREIMDAERTVGQDFLNRVLNRL